MPEVRADAPISIRRAVSGSDLKQAAALAGDGAETREAIFSTRIGLGQACFIATVESEIIAYNWLLLEPCVDEGDVLALRPDEVFGTDAFTAPEWRGRNIHAELLRRMLIFARDNGRRAAYTEVNVFNTRSWKAHRRLGWTVSGRLLALRDRRDRYWEVCIAGTRHPIVRRIPAEAA